MATDPQQKGQDGGPPASYNITVVGIGAMGGGMARALLESPVSRTVVGYDTSVKLRDAFFADARSRGKEGGHVEPPSTLKRAVTYETDFVVLVLQNETQCERVCFGKGSDDNDDNNNLLRLLPEGCCVILCSTVTSTWARRACQTFADADILFVDSPISGGPVRARDGELTLMASGDSESLGRARPVLEAMSRPDQLHVVKGRAGMGSTAKMVHQALAGIHVAAAAEALALAAKSGLDPKQIYDIVNGAAGYSWMFQDRGKRMIEPPASSPSSDADVKSQLQIFVKDLDIVYSEAKRLHAPIPLASAALQQFISGQALGLSRSDDSEIVKVYENVSGVSVAAAAAATQQQSQKSRLEGDQVGDMWISDDGQISEVIVEVADEPRHRVVLSNEYVRAIRVSFPPGDTTLAHRHAEDSLYFFLVEGGFDFVNHVRGCDPVCDCVDFGEIRYGTHRTDKPLIHKITNRSAEKSLLCIDAEVLRKPPVTSLVPLMAEKHDLVKERDRCRVYKLTLEPGESVTATYNFFHLTVVLKAGTIAKEILAGPIRWEETRQVGDVSWKEPVHEIKKTNVGETTFVEFIAEWC